MSRVLQFFLLLLVFSPAWATVAGSASVCLDVHSSKGTTMNEQSTIATPQQPARVVPTDGPSLISKSPALQLTLRPTAVDPEVPFLVQVYARDICNDKADTAGELLGVVSLLPLKLDKEQEFVLPAPEHGFPLTASRNVEITVKLVPANSAGKLEHGSLEVVNARFAD